MMFANHKQFKKSIMFPSMELTLISSSIASNKWCKRDMVSISQYAATKLFGFMIWFVIYFNCSRTVVKSVSFPDVRIINVFWTCVVSQAQVRWETT